MNKDNDDNSEECSCGNHSNHTESHDDGQRMFSDHESIELLGGERKKYHVIMTYLSNATNNDLFNAHITNIEDESLTARYVIKAVNATQAILQALELDKYRKMEVLTGFFKILSKENLKDAGPAGEILQEMSVEVLSDFREFLIAEKAFHKFYMAEPTAIQCTLASNDEIMQKAAMKNTMDFVDNMGDKFNKDIEEWLKKNDNSEE
jgi:hypothetical protein